MTSQLPPRRRKRYLRRMQTDRQRQNAPIAMPAVTGVRTAGSGLEPERTGGKDMRKADATGVNLDASERMPQ